MKFHSKWHRSAGACAVAWLLFQGAAAQADEAEEKDASTIIITGVRDDVLTEEAATGSRLGLTPLETPATVNVVDGNAIRLRGDALVIDAVTRAPGVTYDGNPGNGGLSLAMRGFVGQGSVLQLFNGVRLFPVAGTITFPSDPWNIERIEVLSGPASVLYGQGALGGAVNVIPRQPNEERTEWQGEIGYGSQNSLHIAAGAGAPLGGGFSFRADAAYRQSDGYVDRGDSDNLALSGALKFAPNDDFSITLRNDYGDFHPMKYFGTPLIDGKLDTSIREKNYNVGDATMHFRDNRLGLTIDWKVSDSVTINNTSYYLTSDRIWRNLETYADAGGGLIYRADNYGIVHDQEQYGNQGSVRLSTPLGGTMKNDLLVGIDVSRVNLVYGHQFASDYQEDEVDAYNFDPGKFLDTVGLLPRYRTKTDTFAVYAENRLAITEQLSLVAGIRHESNKVGRWNYVYTAGAISGETPAFPGGVPYKKLDHTTWRLGAVYELSKTVSLYGQYATAVDPLGTLTTYTTSGTQFQLTNADGRQFEAGVKALFMEGRGSFTLAAYRIEKNNLFNQQKTGDPIEQIGKRSSQGIEANLTLSLPGNFSIDANAAVLDANFDNYRILAPDPNNPGQDRVVTDFTGKTPPGVPESSANLELRWSGIDRFQLRGNLRYVGKVYTDNGNTAAVPSYVVVDAGLTYAITDNLGLDLRVYNLFDKDYAQSTYGAEQWILGRPQSFDVSLRASF